MCTRAAVVVVAALFAATNANPVQFEGLASSKPQLSSSVTSSASSAADLSSSSSKSISNDIAALMKDLKAKAASEVVRPQPAQIITGASKSVDPRYNQLHKGETVVRPPPTTGTITGSSKAVVSTAPTALSQKEVVRGQPTTGVITGSSKAVMPAASTATPKPNGDLTIHIHLQQSDEPATTKPLEPSYDSKIQVHVQSQRANSVPSAAAHALTVNVQPALPQASPTVQYAAPAQAQEAEIQMPNGQMRTVLLVPATNSQPCVDSNTVVPPTTPHIMPVTKAPLLPATAAPLAPIKLQPCKAVIPPPCVPMQPAAVPCSLPAPAPEVDEVVQLPNGQLQTVQVPPPKPQVKPSAKPAVTSPVVCDPGQTMCTAVMQASGSNCVVGICTSCTVQMVKDGVECLPLGPATATEQAAPLSPSETLPPGVDPAQVEKILNNLQGSVSNLIGNLRQRAQNSAETERAGEAQLPTSKAVAMKGWPAKAVQSVEAGQNLQVMPGYST